MAVSYTHLSWTAGSRSAAVSFEHAPSTMEIDNAHAAAMNTALFCPIRHTPLPFRHYNNITIVLRTDTLFKELSGLFFTPWARKKTFGPPWRSVPGPAIHARYNPAGRGSYQRTAGS